MVISDHTYTGGGMTFVVIVAAGSGSRYGASVPKQFLLLDSVPVLNRTVDAFRTTLPQAKVVLVLAADTAHMWHGDGVDVVAGGRERSDSVRNALEYIAAHYPTDGARVLIHDGARPLVSEAVINRVVDALRNHSAVVPVVAITDTIAQIERDGALTPVDRAGYRAVQTPQGFRFEMLRAAYAAAEGSTRTDDATIAREFGHAAIHCVEGDPRNIKITRPLDIEIAELLLANR